MLPAPHSQGSGKAAGHQGEARASPCQPPDTWGGGTETASLPRGGKRAEEPGRPSPFSAQPLAQGPQGRLGCSRFTCFGSLPLSLSFSLSLSLLFSFSFLGNNKCELAVAEILLSEVDFPAVEKETCEKKSKFAMLMSDCSSEIKSRLLLGRKAMTNIDSILKSRDITLLTKICLLNTMIFPVVMYGCDSWTIK